MERRVRIAFGVFDLMAAALVMVGIFQGLPARYWPIDGVAGGVALLLTAGGVSLLAGARWTPQVSRVASLLVLAVGLLFLAALAVSASYLAGIYGPVGKGGALILFLIAALALPYLIILPAAQLLWLGRR